MYLSAEAPRPAAAGVSDLHQHLVVPHHLRRPEPDHTHGDGRGRFAPLPVFVVSPVVHHEVFEVGSGENLEKYSQAKSEAEREGHSRPYGIVQRGVNNV